MYERWTDRARRCMQLANQEAIRLNHEYIGTEHMLLGLLKEGRGVAANVLKNIDIDLTKLRAEVEKIVQRGSDVLTFGKMPLTPRAKKCCEYAIEEARTLDHNYVGTEHVLLGLLREPEGVACVVLKSFGLTPEVVRSEALELLGVAHVRTPRANAEKVSEVGNKIDHPLALDDFFRQANGSIVRACVLMRQHFESRIKDLKEENAYIRTAYMPLKDENASLRQRIAELEKRCEPDAAPMADAANQNQLPATCFTATDFIASGHGVVPHAGGGCRCAGDGDAAIATAVCDILKGDVVAVFDGKAVGGVRVDHVALDAPVKVGTRLSSYPNPDGTTTMKPTLDGDIADAVAVDSGRRVAAVVLRPWDYNFCGARMPQAREENAEAVDVAKESLPAPDAAAWTPGREWL